MSVLLDEGIPASAGVAIEYNIPLTNRRVDFILTGKDHQHNDAAVIVELKQWQSVEVTKKDAIVHTWLGSGMNETNHPSIKAWSYAALIENDTPSMHTPINPSNLSPDRKYVMLIRPYSFGWRLL